MTTREENLKKINDKLEQLSDDELDKVAGGHTVSTAYDSQFLQKMGFMDKSYNDFESFFGWSSISKSVDSGWAKAGITCVTDFFNNNKYFKDGKEVSRYEAYKTAADKVGKTFNPDDYNVSRFGLF